MAEWCGRLNARSPGPGVAHEDARGATTAPPPLSCRRGAPMTEPKLASLDAEEALLAALLLFEDFAGLDEFTDDELFYDHIRPFVGAVRMLRDAGKPCGAVFVLVALEPQLDALEWRSDRGEALLMDILGRRVADVQAYYSRQLGRLVHYYAERRKALVEAQAAALLTFNEVLGAARKQYEGELS